MTSRRITKMLGFAAGCLASSAVAMAQSNILTNGDFEADAEGTVAGGTDVIDVTSITGWRMFAVGEATGTATVTGAAGKTGKGIELVRTSPAGVDSAFDKDDPSLREIITPEERLYKLTVDARDGSEFGGTPGIFLEIQFADPTFNRGAGFDPGANFETFGVSARSDAGGTVSTRFGLGAEDRSVHLDNATLVDVTAGANRLINGGLENSAANLLNWRFFDTTEVSGVATLSSEAHSGTAAALLSVTADPAGGDIGLDLEPFRVPTISGEELSFSFASKNVAAASEETRLRASISGFDETGTYTGEILTELVNPTAGGYEPYSFSFDVPEGVFAVNVGFRVVDGALNVNAPGSYLIDDVSVLREVEVGPADFDQDLDVDGDDFLIWQRGNGLPGGVEQGDANDDGAVNGADLEVWKARYGTVGAATAAIAAVPEPAAVIQAGVFLMAGLMWRRPRQR